MSKILDRPLWRILVVTLVLAVATHLLVGAAFFTEVAPPIRADAVDYVAYAYNVKTHGVYSNQPSWVAGWQGEVKPDAKRPPGYPLLLAIFLDGAPTNLFVIRVMLFQALLGVLLVALTFALARTVLGFGPAIAVALLVALTPQLVTQATYLLTEVPFAVCVTAGMLAVALGTRGHIGSMFFLAGVAFGLSALIRPTLIYMPVVLLPVVWFVTRRPAPALALVAAFALVQIPWLVRNERVLGRMNDPTLSIATLHHGSYPDFEYQDDPATLGFPYQFDPATPEIIRSYSSVLAHIGDGFVQRPVRMLVWYLVEKPIYFVAWNPIQGVGDIFVFPVTKSPYLDRPEFQLSRDLMYLLHWPLMLAGYLGAILVWFRRGGVGPPDAQVALRLLSAIFAFVLAVHIAGAPFPRYSVPFRPLQYLFAAYAVMWLHAFVRSRIS